MLRRTIAAVGFSAVALSAHAEVVWMVKSSGSLGCRNRETLVDLDAKQASRPDDGAAPADCVALYSGERLLDQPEVGVGFNEYMKVQRGNGSVVFVRRSAVVPDPGIGSLNDDRPE